MSREKYTVNREEYKNQFLQSLIIYVILTMYLYYSRLTTHLTHDVFCIAHDSRLTQLTMYSVIRYFFSVIADPLNNFPSADSTYCSSAASPDNTSTSLPETFPNLTHLSKAV